MKPSGMRTGRKASAAELFFVKFKGDLKGYVSVTATTSCFFLIFGCFFWFERQSSGFHHGF